MLPIIKNNLKILLLNVSDWGLSGKGYGIPLGLAYLGGVLEKCGSIVKVIDFAKTARSSRLHYLKTSPWAEKEIQQFNPDIIGLTGSTQTRLNIKFWADTAKSICPESLVIGGGPHASSAPESLMKSCSSIDAICINEAEITIQELARAFEDKNKDFSGIDGVVWRREGKILYNKAREPITNLDDIPFPARNLFNLSDYDLRMEGLGENILTMVTSRGCIARCKFCAAPSMSPKYRYRSPDNIIAEIEEVCRLYPEIDSIMFFDDTLTGNKGRLIEILKKLKKLKKTLPWACWSRADILSDKVAKQMYEAGCRVVSFGIESGSQRILDEIKKNTTVEQGYKSIENCKNNGIKARATFITGVPGETDEDIYKTLEFIKKSGLNEDASFALGIGLLFFPKTPWFEEYLANNPEFTWNSNPAGENYLRDPYGNMILPNNILPLDKRKEFSKAYYNIINPKRSLIVRAASFGKSLIKEFFEE